MSYFTKYARSPVTAAAITAAAATAALSAVICAIIYKLAPGWPVRLIPRFDVVPIPDSSWAASWEVLAKPPATGPHDALTTLTRTALQLGSGVVAIAGFSLMLHTISRVIAEWRGLVIRCALGATLRTLMVHATTGLLGLGVTGCAGGLVAGAATLTFLRATWPALLTRPNELAPLAGVSVAATIGVCVFLALIALMLLFPLHRGVRVAADLHGEHVTARGPLMMFQNVLAALQLVGLLVVSYGFVLVISGGAPAARGDMRQTYPDSMVVLPLHLKGPGVSSAAARSAVYLALSRALDAVDAPRAAITSPDAWVGLGKQLTLISVCPFCRVGIQPMPMVGAKVRMVALAPGALAALNVGVYKGRDFTRADSIGAKRYVVLNAHANYQLFQNGPSAGLTVMASFRAEDQYTVRATAESITPEGLGAGSGEAIVYVSILQHPPEIAEIAARARDVQAVRRIVDEAGSAPGVRAVPGTPLPLERRLRDFEAPLRWFPNILTVLAVAAMLIAIIALEAVMTQLVVLRERDIAIRMALGANRAQIVEWVIRRALAITMAGAIAGVSVARWLGDVMREHLIGSETDDLYILALLIASFSVIAIVASLRAAWKATAVQPAAVWAKTG